MNLDVFNEKENRVHTLVISNNDLSRKFIFVNASIPKANSILTILNSNLPPNIPSIQTENVAKSDSTFFLKVPNY